MLAGRITPASRIRRNFSNFQKRAVCYSDAEYFTSLALLCDCSGAHRLKLGAVHYACTFSYLDNSACGNASSGHMKRSRCRTVPCQWLQEAHKAAEVQCGDMFQPLVSTSHLFGAWELQICSEVSNIGGMLGGVGKGTQTNGDLYVASSAWRAEGLDYTSAAREA